MNVSSVPGLPFPAHADGVESKEERVPLPVASEKASAVAQPPSGFLANLFRKVAALCHSLEQEVDGEVTHEQLKLIGENALVSEEKIAKLWGFIMRSKVPETYTAKIGRVASHAITALNLAKFSFSGKDLNGVNIPGANLSRGLFYKTHFIGANLQGVQFHHAHLGDVLLQKADLRGVDFGEFSLKAHNVSIRNAGRLAVQGSLVAIGESGEVFIKYKEPPRIHIWSLSESKAESEGNAKSKVKAEYVCSWQQDAKIFSLALMKDHKRLVSAGVGDCVSIWNPNNGALLHKLYPILVCKEDLISKDSANLVSGLMDAGLIRPVPSHPNYVQLICSPYRLKEWFYHKKKEVNFLEIFPHVTIIHFAISQSSNRPMILCICVGGSRGISCSEITLFDLASGQLEDLIPIPRVINALFMPDEISLLILTDTDIQLFNTRTKETIKTWLVPDLNQTVLAPSAFTSTPSVIKYIRMILSLDGKLIAVACSHKIFIWSIEYSEPIKQLNRSSGTVIVFSNDGQLLAIDAGRAIQIWNTKTWQLHDYFGKGISDSDVMDLQFTSDNQCLIVIFSDAEPKVWKISSDQLPTQDGCCIKALSVTSDGKSVFAMFRRTLRKWNARTGACELKVDQCTDQFVVSKNGCYLLTLHDKYALLSEVETNRDSKCFIYESAILGIYFLSDDRVLIIEKEKVEIYDIQREQLFSLLKGKTSSLTVHTLSDDRQWLAWGTEGGDLMAWNTITENLYTLERVHEGPVRRIKFSRGAISSYGPSYFVYIWIPLNGFQSRLFHMFLHQTDIDDDMSRLPNKPCVAVPEKPNPLSNKPPVIPVIPGILSSVKSYDSLESLDEVEDPLLDVGLLTAPDTLVVPVDSNYWFLVRNRHDINVYTKQDQGTKLIRIRQLPIWHQPIPNKLSGDADSDYASSFDSDFESENVQQAPSTSVMVLHPSALIIAVGSSNGMIQLWNFANGQRINDLWGHVAGITSLTFSDDGHSLFSSSQDRTLQRWDLSGGIENATLVWRSGPHSLVLDGINTHEAILDEDSKALLQSVSVRTSSAPDHSRERSSKFT